MGDSINSLKDLHSLALFLGISGGLENKSRFVSLMNGHDRQYLQAFVAEMCLRRTKAMPFVNLKLPPKIEHVEYVQFSAGEREKYDVLL